jgi:LmbE family N-acetylglucosaminyl deacetylase
MRTHTPTSPTSPTSPIPSTGTLLGVWAHPDDEAFLSSALMATARDAGHRVVVLTATRGEHGTDNPEVWPPHQLAAVRERELGASLAVLGVTEQHWLGYADGGLATADRDDAVDRIAGFIDQVRPTTIVTFGPDGMTGHDDHRTVSSWVTEAREKAGHPNRLWYATVTPDFHEQWGEVNDRVRFWFEGTQPPVTPREHLAAEIVCDLSLARRKHAALRAHSSQTDQLAAVLGEERFAQWWATESFVEAPRRTA